MNARSETGARSAALPVLLLASAPNARTIRAALGDELALTITDDVARGRALAATGGFVAILAVGPLAGAVPDAVSIDPSGEPGLIFGIVAASIARTSTSRPDDDVASLAYDEYIELARYAITRRYLIALLNRHGGSVTDAAREASMKRESLHRLLRRHHLIADDFRLR